MSDRSPIPSAPAVPPSAAPRLEILDQMRGYAIAGMIFVNFLGDFAVMPWTFKHHREGMSYADTIAPLFVFVVGMGFRLSFARRRAESGAWRARGRALVRYLALTGVGMLYYGTSGGLRGANWWDALYDIGLAGVLSLPFLERSAAWRVAGAAFWLAVYQAIFSLTDYGAWVKAHSWNGGPLGPVSYAFVLLTGTLATDWILEGDDRRKLTRGLAWGVGLCALGWILRAPWGGLKAEWPFSQYYMSAPYPVYSTGLSFLAFVGFHLLNERAGRTIPTLTTLGRNALAVYVVHLVLIRRNIGWFEPETDPAWKALIGFAGIYAACWLMAWKFRREGIAIKV